MVFLLFPEMHHDKALNHATGVIAGHPEDFPVELEACGNGLTCPIQPGVAQTYTASVTCPITNPVLFYLYSLVAGKLLIVEIKKSKRYQLTHTQKYLIVLECTLYTYCVLFMSRVRPLHVFHKVINNNI